MAVYPPSDKAPFFGPQSFAEPARNGKETSVESLIEWRHCPGCKKRYGVPIHQAGQRCCACGLLLVHSKHLSKGN